MPKISLKMNSSMSLDVNVIQQKLNDFNLGSVCKSIAIPGLLFFMLYAILFHLPCYENPQLFAPNRINTHMLASPNNSNNVHFPTNLSHILFGIAGSVKTLKHKKPYFESWWRPNSTRGYLFLEEVPRREFHPWPVTSPPFKVCENLTKLSFYHKIKRPIPARIARTVVETVRLGEKDVRWYVMSDDDTIFILENLVDVLAKYDHTKYFYIGANSEFVKSNFDFAFEMAYGGAGYVLSAPLAELLAMNFDECLDRYADLWVSDMMIHQCLADFGVDLTHEPGFHQVDLLDDISGFLASHPQAPFVTFHHLDTIYPLYPGKNQVQSVRHLLKAAGADHSRLLQQTICYHRPRNWTFSIAWGYTAQIYEMVLPRCFLRRPLETFKPWSDKIRPPYYMFNTRWRTNNPCDTPHSLYLESVRKTAGNNQTVAIYTRKFSRNLPSCLFSGNHSADHITKIQVFAPTTHKKEGIECCDVTYRARKNLAKVKFRTCMKDEILA